MLTFLRTQPSAPDCERVGTPGAILAFPSSRHVEGRLQVYDIKTAAEKGQALVPFPASRFMVGKEKTG